MTRRDRRVKKEIFQGLKQPQQKRRTQSTKCIFGYLSAPECSISTYRLDKKAVNFIVYKVMEIWVGKVGVKPPIPVLAGIFCVLHLLFSDT